MQDHSDDCKVVHTGICTCTRGIGQPAAQLTRKLLVDEYQRGLTQGRKEGEEAAIAKFIALQNRDTLFVPDSVDNNPTQPIQKLHHRHLAGEPTTVGIPTDYSVPWTSYLWALILALGIFLIVGVGLWYAGIVHWPLWAIGASVASFMGAVIKLDYDARKRYDVHRAQ